MTNASSPSWGNQVTWSLSESFSAYEWWPCKQSLRDKADSCSVKITVPSNCKAGSNGILENVVDLGNGTSRYEWKHRHPIDYYLISVAVAEYVDYSTYANPVGATNPILIQNYVYNNPQTLTNFQTEIDETAAFIELYSALFGLYPFADEKYGHCMAPLSGGMEHQTMTTQGFFEKSLTSHELAHQWFGDQVTCASWSDIWVNEGFASYAEYIMLENMYPAEKNADMTTRHNNIMQQLGGSVWVLDSLNEGAIFSSRLVYDKGAAIIHTLRFLVNNDSLFYLGLRNYQAQFKDSVATGLDVKQALENVSGINLSNAFEEWYYGEGFPTYSVVWNNLNSNLQLKIAHNVSMPMITPTFTNDLELRISRTGMGDTILRFPIQSNSEEFVITGIPNVSGVNAIDPNNWIIDAPGTITYNPNYTATIAETTSDTGIQILPNPFNGIVQIALAQKGPYTLKLIDPQGKYISSYEFDQNLVLDLTKQSKGMYLIQIESATSNQIIRRILKN
jgi:aminopeptidase N